MSEQSLVITLAKKAIKYPAAPCVDNPGEEDICDHCRFAWQLTLGDRVIAAINEAIEECAKKIGEVRVVQRYCVGRDLLTVDDGCATLIDAMAAVRSLKSESRDK